MPEITAVQFMTENLHHWLHNQEIVEVAVLSGHNSKRIHINNMPVPSGIMQKVERRGKTSIITFPVGYLVLQYQLSGKIISNLNPPTKTTRLIWTLSNGKKLYWVDKINFGSIHWCSTIDEVQVLLNNIGPEFWPIQRSGAWWQAQCQSRSPIHKVLIDQSRVAGIGNIIAIETLHRSKIHPKTPANTLTIDQWTSIALHVLDVVELSHQQHNRQREIQRETMTFDGSLSLVSEGHTRAEGYNIYGRKGETCPICRVEQICKETLGGRPIYLCPHCQK